MKQIRLKKIEQEDVTIGECRKGSKAYLYHSWEYCRMYVMHLIMVCRGVAGHLKIPKKNRLKDL